MNSSRQRRNESARGSMAPPFTRKCHRLRTLLMVSSSGLGAPRMEARTVLLLMVLFARGSGEQRGSRGSVFR